jgi:hypothetical protein
VSAAGGPPGDSDDTRERGRWVSLAGLAVIVLLVLAGYALVKKLSAVSALQDCVMSGRTNCAPIAPPPD